MQGNAYLGRQRRIRGIKEKDRERDRCRETEEGKRIAEKKADRYPDDWKRLESVAARFLAAGDVDYLKMSVAAKTFFILSNSGKPATATELRYSASRLGWNPTPQEMEESIEFLKKLGLVKT